MGRGAWLIGVLLVALLSGCGGGSPSGPPGPPRSMAAARAEVRQSVDAKLAKLDAPPKQVACIDRHIEAMTAGQFAHRLVEGRIVGPGAPKETPKSVAGALGKGCL